MRFRPVELLCLMGLSTRLRVWVVWIFLKTGEEGLSVCLRRWGSRGVVFFLWRGPCLGYVEWIAKSGGGARVHLQRRFSLFQLVLQSANVILRQVTFRFGLLNGRFEICNGVIIFFEMKINSRPNPQGIKRCRK